MTVVIVGAGLAGIAAAVRLTDAGLKVLLFERSRHLGGRAGSAPDPTSGRELDFGQHVYLYCCERYRLLLRRLGTESLAPLHRPMRIRVIDAHRDALPGKGATLYSTSLPTGLHLVPAFLRYNHLSVRERTETARILLRLLHRDRTAGELETLTFGDWLRGQGASENSLRSFWNVVTVAALNAAVDDVSAAWGFMLFQTGLLANRRAAEVGVSQVPLSRLVAPAEKVIADGGGKLLLQSPVAQVEVERGRAKGVRLADGTRVPADAVVVATAHRQLPGLLPHEHAGHPFFSEVLQLPVRPIIDVHMGFAAPVTSPEFSFAVFLNSPVQWVFAHEGGRRLAVSISNPVDFRRAKRDEIAGAVTAEVQRLFRCGRPEWIAVRRHASATFDVGPGKARFRRPQKTPIARLYVAGDWTDTGWPATMEGAVRSGELAADAVLQDLR